MTDTFQGWPADGLAFLAELEQDNTRGFWMAHMHRYRDGLLEPTRALAGALTGEFGELRVVRPHVDRRFRPTVAPYRTDTGAIAAGPGGTRTRCCSPPAGSRCRSGTGCSTPGSSAATGRP